MPITSSNPVVRHFVAFRYRTDLPKAERHEVIARFLALKELCKYPNDPNPYILSIETGKANSTEHLDQQMVDGFLVTFKSEPDRDYYVKEDKAHEEFKSFLGGKLHPDEPKAFVFDYTVGVS